MKVSVNKIRASLGSGKQSRPDKVPCGRLWPHGEWSLGYRKERLEATSEAEEWKWLSGGEPLLDSPHKFSQEQLEPFAEYPSCSWPRRKYGQNGITGFGRKMVQSGVSVLARRLGQKRLTFCTLTLPPLDKARRALVAESWGETLRQLIQWLCRRLKRSGLEQAVVSVSEIQPKRLSKTGEGYLHLHLCWEARTRDRKRWSVEIKDLRAWWEARLCKVCNIPSIPSTQIKIETVRSNVSAYMAKYMSKGAEGIAEYKGDCGEEGIPGQWWNMSKTARDWTKKELLQGDAVGLLLETMVNGLFDGCWGEWPGGIRAVSVNVDGHLITVGYCGYFEERTLRDLTGLLKSGLIQIFSEDQ